MIWADHISRSFRSVILASMAWFLVSSTATAGVLVAGDIDGTITIQASANSGLALGDGGNYYLGLGSDPFDLQVMGASTLNGVSINAFCVDLLTNIFFNGVYDKSLVSNNGTVDSLDQTLLSSLSFPVQNPYGNATGLVGNAGAMAYLVRNFGMGSLSTDARDGLQAAIFKVEYGNDFNLIQNGVGGSLTTQGAWDAYNADLAAVGYPNGLLSSPLASALWISPGTDDQTYPGHTFDPPGGFGYPVQGLVAAVPLPGSLAIWLCMAITGALAFVSRRKFALA